MKTTMPEPEILQRYSKPVLRELPSCYSHDDTAAIASRQVHEHAVVDHDDTLSDNMPEGGYLEHEIASVLPMLDDEEFADLANDIKQNGLRDTIVLSPEGDKIIEGRNRQKAALSVGVQPRFRLFNPATDGESLAAFVTSKNFRRRHLSPSQRAAYAVDLLPFFEKEAAARQRHEPQPDTAEGAAKEGGLASNDAKGGKNGSKVAPHDELSQETGYDVANESQAKPRKGKAAAQAVGVSQASVERAKHLKKTDPKAFEASKAPKKKATVSEEQLEKAIDRIEKICGQAQAKAIREGDLMRSKKDVVAYAALSDTKMLAIRALIDQGWTVKRATHFKAEDLLPTHTIRQAMHRAIAAGGAYLQKVQDESGGLIANVAIEMVFGERARKQKAKRGHGSSGAATGPTS
jgi:ParB-like chromosome segregation protein Spo0J